MFLSNAPSLIHRLVERWQLGGIFSWTSGAPLDIGATTSSITASTNVMTASIAGDFSKSTGKVTKLAKPWASIISTLDASQTPPAIERSPSMQG
jgi:hypothetical protein